MASSSGVKRHQVFMSFHGPDVRRGFLSHLRGDFESKGITTFNDENIVRGQSIGPELVNAIKESRILLVLLSQNYASSGWCLEELVEIMKYKESSGHTVLTIFYEVDPSSVRKQTGDFGKAFKATCEARGDEVKKLIWSKALTEVANIEGEHSNKWRNEAEGIQKIATDVLSKLSVTPSRDFVDGMVGMEAHLKSLRSLLCLERGDEKKMIGMWGPAGIGKTTIARALYNQLSGSFPFKCFMGNLKGSFKKEMGVDIYNSQLNFQGKFLSDIFHTQIRVHNSSGIKDRLQDQKVLIILDDVDNVEKLDLLAKDLSWFGPGSRIIVTTQYKGVLKEHKIDDNDIYNVGFPSKKEACEIISISAFEGTSEKDGFEDLVEKVAEFCSNLPLGLVVVGKSLRGHDKEEWESQLKTFKISLKGSIEETLRVGYDNLTKQDQALFLHIACFFFFNENVDRLTTMLADSTLISDVQHGLKTLADRSLVHTSFNKVEMHSLLQKLGREIADEQSDEPGKRKFLIDPKDIRDVLEGETGTESLISIYFDMTNTKEITISGRAFERMRNLQFLQIYTQLGMEGGNVSSLYIREDLEFLPRLKLLDWNSFPGERLPATFLPDRLVELDMQSSNLEKLWDGIQPLANLKKIILDYSHELKEIPNLSRATNLERLSLSYCTSLVELPCSIKSLQKLKKLRMRCCTELRVIPTNIELESLKVVNMSYCPQLGIFPDFSSNIKSLSARGLKIKDIPASVGRWSRCRVLKIGSKSIERLTRIPVSVTSLDLINSGIKRIPDSIIGLPHLVDLIVENCTKLTSIPALPTSLKSLNANNCVSLETVHCSFHSRINVLTFYNCLKLDEETRKGIIQQSVHDYICLSAKEIPAEFTHKATGKSITIPLAPGGDGTFSASSRVKACFLLSPVARCQYISIGCRLHSKGGDQLNSFYSSARITRLSPLSENLFIFRGDLFSQENKCHEVSEITFEFSCRDNDDKIIECGVQILAEESEGSCSNSEVENFETASNCSNSEVKDFETESNCSDLSVDFVEVILSLFDEPGTTDHRHKTWRTANLILAVFDSKIFPPVPESDPDLHLKLSNERFRCSLRFVFLFLFVCVCLYVFRLIVS